MRFLNSVKLLLILLGVCSCVTVGPTFENNKIYKSFKKIGVPSNNLIKIENVYKQEMQLNSAKIASTGKTNNIHAYSLKVENSGDYRVGITSYKKGQKAVPHLFTAKPYLLNSKGEKVEVSGGAFDVHENGKDGAQLENSYVVRLSEKDEYRFFIVSNNELVGKELFRIKEQIGPTTLAHKVYYGSDIGRYAFRIREIKASENLYESKEYKIRFHKQSQWTFVSKEKLLKMIAPLKTAINPKPMEAKINRFLVMASSTKNSFKGARDIVIPISFSIERMNLGSLKGKGLIQKLDSFIKIIQKETGGAYHGYFKPKFTSPQISNFKGKAASFSTGVGKNPISGAPDINWRLWLVEHNGQAIILSIGSSGSSEVEVNSFEQKAMNGLDLK